MAFQPMPLSRKPAPFDHPEWIFELKYDGFRSLAVLHGGRCDPDLPQWPPIQLIRFSS
jgi:ATP-dependent DNA ligase